MGDYFCQMCVIYFCPRFSCCLYYWGVCKARADCIYFGSGKREAFKQDMFISMHLLLLFGGGGEGSKGGLPIMACTRRLCPKGRVSFSDLRYLTPKPQYLNSNSPDWSPYISLKNQLREFVYWSKLFPSGDHFINSHSIFSRLCIDIVEWKDRENCHLQCCQLSCLIRETPDFGLYLLVSRLEYEISWIITKVCNSSFQVWLDFSTILKISAIFIVWAIFK